MDGGFRRVERDYSPGSSEANPAPQDGAAVPATSNVVEPVKAACPPPAALPTMIGPLGIHFDVNDGARGASAQSDKREMARPPA